MNADEHRSKRSSLGVYLRRLIGLGFVSLAVGASVYFAGAMKSDLGWMALGGFVLCCLALAALMQPAFVAGFRKGLREFVKACNEISDGK